MSRSQDLAAWPGDRHRLPRHSPRLVQHITCEDPRVPVLNALHRFLTDTDARTGDNAHRSRIRRAGAKASRLQFGRGSLSPIFIDAHAHPFRRLIEEAHAQ